MSFEVKDGCIMIPLSYWKEISVDITTMDVFRESGIENWEGYAAVMKKVKEIYEEEENYLDGDDDQPKFKRYPQYYVAEDEEVEHLNQDFLTLN
jgi:hypothetical protein